MAGKKLTSNKNYIKIHQLANSKKYKSIDNTNVYKKQQDFENSFISLSFNPLPYRDKFFVDKNNNRSDKISRAFLYCWRSLTENLDEKTF